jgi:membrane fusion protein (multidrug efflux system)
MSSSKKPLPLHPEFNIKQMLPKKEMVAFIMAVFFMSSCKQREPKNEETSYPVMEVVTTDRSFTSSYSATIRGKSDIDIFPQVSGYITELHIEEGEAVKKSQTLFIIDQVPYKAALQTATANVNLSESNVAMAQLTFDSKQELFNNNVVSSFELQTAKNALVSAKAQLEQALAQQIVAQNNLSYTVIKSPSNGVAGILPFKIGALVSPAQPQPLTTISDNSVVYIYFSLTENQLLSLIRKYESVDKAIRSLPPIQLQLSDGSIYSQAGRIETVSGVIDAVTGSVTLRAVFPNQSRLLHSGGSGNVIIPYEKPDCIVIPKSATFEVQDKLYVYKNVDGVAKSTPVQVISISGSEYIVESGLQKGEIIVAEGAGFIRENTPLRITN